MVAWILSCRLLLSRDVGDKGRHCVGDTLPLIKAAALGEALLFSGEDSEEKRFRAGLTTSEAKERTEERPGTVLMVEDGPLGPARAALYGSGELNMLKDLGEAGGVTPLSRRGLPPPDVVMGEVLADSPLVDTNSGTLLPGEARGLGASWTGYWAC